MYKNKLNLFLTSILLVFLTVNCSKDNSDEPSGSDTLQSDISLTLSVNNSSPIIGDNVTFKITVTNSGPDNASNISVKSLLPSGYTFVSDNGTAANSYDAVSGIWTILNLNRGLNISLNLIATVNNSGNYECTAELISSDNFDPDSSPNNNSLSEDDQDSVTITPVQPSSVQVTTIATLNAADGLALDEFGNIFASNYNNDIVYKIDTDHNISTFISNQDGAAGITFDGQGFIYLARYESRDIVKISADGSSIEPYASGVAAPIGIAFDSDGNLFTNNNVNNSITKIDINGNKSVQSISINNNSSVAVDENNNKYVTDYNSGRIIKIDATTNQESVFTNLPISGGVGYIIYSNGNFYATAVTDQLIFKIDTNGQHEIIAGIQSKVGVKDGNGNVATFNRPIGIAASPDGKTLYVGQNGGSGAIRVITGF